MSLSPESLAIQVSTQALQTSAPKPTTTLDAAKDDDVSKFLKALNTAQQGEPTSSGQNPFSGHVLGGTEVSSISDQALTVNEKTLPSLGDKMLQGMQDFRTTFKKSYDDLSAQLIDPSTNLLDPQASFKIFGLMTSLVHEVELSTKVADKSSQGVQIMFKTQGG